jgi:Ca2+-binding RTX toxin-like protein
MGCLGSYNNNSISSAMYSSNDALVFLYPFADTSGSNFTIPSLAQSFGYDGSSALTITGTAYNDTVSDRNSDIDPGGYSISTYAGIDIIDVDNSKAADTVDAGADNDFVFVTTASGKSFTSDTAIKGGSGSDWLIIDSAYSSGTNTSINYTINSSPTSGFENVLLSSGDDTLTGDALDNILLGSGGADTISGLAGNDSLYGYSLMEGGCSYDGSSDGSDKLYGGDGDDLLVGGAGDDLFDGGVGQDTLTGDGGIVSCGYEASYTQGGASGSDTFVIRAGDGGSSISDADIITDFTDGTDIIGMSGLNYSDLTIEQGTDSYSSHVVVKKTSSGEFLTIIQNISLSSEDDNDFSAI